MKQRSKAWERALTRGESRSVCGRPMYSEYRLLLTAAQGAFKRIDPYAREVTNSVGNAIVHDPSFDWAGDVVHLAPWNELVIYELHVGTFNDEEDTNSPSTSHFPLAPAAC